MPARSVEHHSMRTIMDGERAEQQRRMAGRPRNPARRPGEGVIHELVAGLTEERRNDRRQG
jgi:hypothetical protein